MSKLYAILRKISHLSCFRLHGSEIEVDNSLDTSLSDNEEVIVEQDMYVFLDQHLADI